MKYVIKNIIKILCYILIFLIISLIHIFTYEFGKNKKVTFHKIKRIKWIYRKKIFLYQKFPILCQYIGFYENFKKVNDNFKDVLWPVHVK